MELKGYQNGYEAAIEAMKAAKYGIGQQSSPAGAGASADPLPKLPFDQDGNPQGGNSGSGQGEQSDEMTGEQGKIDGKTQNEIDAADTNAMGGGWISQEAGAKLAADAGYEDEDCKEESLSKISTDWREATVKACSQTVGKGMGNTLAFFDKYYKTKHDWKGELRNIIGKALSSVKIYTKWGKAKPLAVFDEIKKKHVAGELDPDAVIYCVDTSGSVSDKLLERMVSECYTISAKKGFTQATYVMFDDGITQIEHIKGKTMPKFKLKGRGGTNFKNLFTGLDKEFGGLKHKCPLVMIFTDGYCSPVPKRLPWMENLIWVAYDNKTFGQQFEKDKSDPYTRVLFFDTSDM